MPTRNQVELGMLLGLSSTCALAMGALAYLRITPGSDGKPRPRLKLQDFVLGPKDGSEDDRERSTMADLVRKRKNGLIEKDNKAKSYASSSSS